jgi:hypothetical protein
MAPFIITTADRLYSTAPSGTAEQAISGRELKYLNLLTEGGAFALNSGKAFFYRRLAGTLSSFFRWTTPVLQT